MQLFKGQRLWTDQIAAILYTTEQWQRLSILYDTYFIIS